MHNLRSWNEWSDAEPKGHMGGCIEAEFVNELGRLEYATVRQYHYADARGSIWGHSTGTWREENYKVLHPKYYRWRFVGPLVPSKEAQGKAIIVWSFYDAPGELRCLSRHGGDEDWVALIPVDAERPSWTDSGSSFGCCDVSEHTYEDGRTVLIGAHA